MKTIEMRKWHPESPLAEEERDTLIKGIAADLADLPEGGQSVLIGGNTLVFGAVDGDGKLCIYECEILRANVDAVDDLTAVIISDAPKLLQ